MDQKEYCASGERLEMARWLLTRYDVLRLALVTRSTVVLSANALIVAGATLLTSRSISSGLYGGRLTLGLVSLLGLITLLLSGISIGRAVQALLNLRPWRKTYGDSSTPPALFFDASDTVEHFATGSTFAAAFQASTDQDLLGHATADLWFVIRRYHRRYHFLRKAAWSLLAALATFLVTALVWLAGSVLAGLR